ncbi:MAG: hypothetical protein AB7G93_11250 [Bdellovibrionales bacterium]
MTRIFLMGALFLSFSAGAASPRYELSWKNGADLYEFVNTNPWFQELKRTNLYEGILLRLGPLLGALPKSQNPTWQGRLADALLELALKNRPVHIYHFHEPELVQPTAFAVQNLNALESRALRAAVDSLRSVADQNVDAGGSPLTVTPVSVAHQKLAVRLAGGCMAVSRDPRVAVWAWQKCRNEKNLHSDLRLSVDVRSLSAGTEIALAKFIGIGERFEIDFQKTNNATYEAVRATLPLRSAHRLRNAKLNELHLQALPSNTNGFATVGLPAPKVVSPDAIKAFLAAPGDTDRTQISATYFHLGAFRRDAGGVVAETGLLIDIAPGQKPEAWAEIFQPSFGRDVYVRGVCGGKLALITPRAAVIAKVEAACSGKEPSLMQIPVEMRQTLGLRNLSRTQVMLVNLGKTLSHLVELGWQVDHPQEAAPKEVLEAKKILSRLPTLAFGGTLQGPRIEYQVKSGVF